MKVILQILLLLIIISTISICVVKPDMHKSVIVYNSDYNLVTETQAVVEKEEIPIMEIPVKPKETAVKKEQKTEKVVTTTKPQVVKTVKKQTPVKITENKKQQTVVQQPQKIVTQVKKEPETVKIEKTVKQEPPKVLTQQEEEIAWNIWRSNLQNKIMKDVFLPSVPEGTIFRFSFITDKYGRVTNVQTYATPSSYTPYAIQYIAPVIRSYQGKDILNFPTGSTRVSTEVRGGWKISSNERYSTPQDYNDIEKVVK